jgi:hypothetical protein
MGPKSLLSTMGGFKDFFFSLQKVTFGGYWSMLVIKETYLLSIHTTAVYPPLFLTLMLPISSSVQKSWGMSILVGCTDLHAFIFISTPSKTSGEDKLSIKLYVLHL